MVLVDNAERLDYAQTMLIEGADKPATRGALATLFHATADHVVKGNAGKQIDIHIVVGRDFDPNLLPSSQ